MDAQDKKHSPALPSEWAYHPLSSLSLYRLACEKLKGGTPVMSNVEQVQWESDCIAFMHHLTDACKSCLRTYNCPNCSINTAKALLKRKDEIGSQHRKSDKPINQIKIRSREILGILGKAGKPLRARDIKLQSTSSRNIKWWTLKRLVNKGLVHKCRVKNIYGRYETAYYTKGKEQ